MNALTDPRYLAVLTTQALVPLVLASEAFRVVRGEITAQTLSMFESRLRRYVLPRFGGLAVGSIQYPDLVGFVDWLSGEGLHPASIRHVLISLRKVMNWAVIHQHLASIPAFPKIKTQSTPRGGFTPREYLRLWHAAKRLAKPHDIAHRPSHRDTQGGFFAKHQPVPQEFAWMIGFMVNSFIRPSDLKLIQHQHVQVVRGKYTYLRLSLPETKKHTVQIVTLRPAVRLYEALLKDAQARGFGQPQDFLFLPEVTNRTTAMVLMDVHFRRITEAAGVRQGPRNQSRTLYSLRHTAITFRLLYGSGVDLLTLARNARTSVEMVEKFYASELSAEMNIGMLQRRR